MPRKCERCDSDEFYFEEKANEDIDVVCKNCLKVDATYTRKGDYVRPQTNP